MTNYSKKSIFLSKAFILSLIALSFSHSAKASEINVKNIISLVNKAREERNISALKENEKLNDIAADKLSDMISNKYFAHTSPTGVTPWSWYQKEGYDYKYAGENLAINFFTAEDEQKAWMNSETHRKNILNDKFHEIGVAVGAGEINGQNAIIAVQEFGTLISDNSIPNNPNNFSGKEKTNLIKEGVKIGPQVLSSRDVGMTSEDGGAPVGDSSWREMSFEVARIISLIAVALALALAPLGFMAVAVSNLMFMIEDNKKATNVK
jgi:uncharacterized protein YkwD